ncbi:protein AATF [Brachionichthys hirsutus]|uniref:protein AATF n=1 Tax=Brachionichthys hirsutus TaxID=412623 RepID=UPI0036048AD6
MAGSFSRELEELLNPLPKFADPEDEDDDEATKARVIDEFGEEDDEEDGSATGALRKRNAFLPTETDERYSGIRVSRKQLLLERSADEDEDEDDGEKGDTIKGDSTGDEESDDDDDDVQPDAESGAQTKQVDATFHKPTDGMDELGVGDDDDDSADASEEDDDDDDEGDEDAVRTFSKAKVDEEVEKGEAVRKQLALWDRLLEGRIRLQKALATANQLPQPQSLPEFKRRGGAELAGGLESAHGALGALQRSLLELHEQLLQQNPETRRVALETSSDEDEEEEEEEEAAAQQRGAPKRKLDIAAYPDLMAKRFAAFQPYRNATLQKWHDKTRLTLGKSRKGFGAFDRSVLTQVEQVLADRERLVRRTRTRRSEYRVLGKKEALVFVAEPVLLRGPEEPEPRLEANAHLKDLDQDIFDDDDFYHQLLRELIERKTSSVDANDQVAMGRQWLAIQKLRSKIKRKVDTKASKGRRVRFHPHSKLVNFMAPVDRSSVGDEARSELYRGLFGRTAAERP